MKGCSPSPDSACIRLPGLLGVIHNAATIFFGFYSFALRTGLKHAHAQQMEHQDRLKLSTEQVKPNQGYRSYEALKGVPTPTPLLEHATYSPQAQNFVQYIESHTRLKQNTPTSNKWSVVNKIMWGTCVLQREYTREEGLPTLKQH